MGETAALVHRSPLRDALVELFEAGWQQATPVFGGEAQETEEQPALSETDRALLDLLHAGLKDKSLARQPGLSERTLRRRITDLTPRLGATSRFQAGAQAVQPRVALNPLWFRWVESERLWAPVLPQAPAPTHPCPRWSW
ncbi:hypothetical protein [Streptomyces mirabilis]|uniref:hypothetical protein n=1 Tax=Streptomyces mirabilis TaxID=68239 RepID=UPI0036D0996B